MGKIQQLQVNSPIMENIEETMLFPLPGNCTLGLSSETITKLKDNFKDQGKMYLHKAMI